MKRFFQKCPEPGAGGGEGVNASDMKAYWDAGHGLREKILSTYETICALDKSENTFLSNMRIAFFSGCLVCL